MPHRRFGSAAWFVSSLALQGFLGLVAGPAPAAAMHAPGAPFAPDAASAGTQAQLGPFKLTLGASLGQIGGTATELAFAYPRGEQFRVSELTWDIKEVAVAGVQGSLRLGSRFSLNLGAWWALNEGSGEMVDRDWLYYEAIAAGLLDPGDVGDEDWTHESRHPDTTVDHGTMYDLNLSFRALRSGAFSVSALVGYKRDEWGWSSRGGTYVYSVDGFRDRSGAFKNPDGSDPLVITYEQQYEVPYVGLAAALDGAVFQAEAHLLASWAARATDRDYHALRDTTFEGDFAGGTWFGAGASATWLFAPRWYATLAVEYEKFDEMTGDVTVDAPEGRYLFVDGGGMGLEAVMLLAGAGFRF